MWELLKVNWKFRLIHYGFFLSFTGGLTTFIGPDRNHWIKLAIGLTIGCIILGDKLIKGVKSLSEWTNEYFNDNIES